MRVDLIVTGETEQAGLAGALSRLFPGHELRVQCLSGFTSATLPAGGIVSRSGAHSAAVRLAAALTATLAPGRNGVPADFAVVLDDLELANDQQPRVVTRTFREAVLSHLNEVEQRAGAPMRDRCESALRERGSFHLVKPMIEAWFFPDPVAVSHLGIPTSAPRLRPGDPEAFHTDDPAFDADDETSCSGWIRGGRDRKHRPKWLGEDRQRHPKAYVQWLTRDGADERCCAYRESRHGGTALANLDLAVLLRRPPAEFAYLRALTSDLADALELPDPSRGAPNGAATHRAPTLRNAVLRNL